VVEGLHGFIEPQLQREIVNKWHAECAVGILNAPDPSHNPATDEALIRRYSAEDHPAGKAENKRFLQETLGLKLDPQAPLFFWPSRLDSVQKGCQLLAEILSPVVSKYWERNLQVVFVANGEFQRHFRDIVRVHRISSRVSVCDFDEHLSRLAYGASDFILMPSRFEPCGLPQMIAPIYGSLPVAHDTGGIHDTVSHLDVGAGSGNGFLFKYMDSTGLFWVIDQAMNFYALPDEVRAAEIRRIMNQSAREFNHSVTARHYIDLYEKMLKRPLINIQGPQ
jgi:starch synthase/alpha-amylase